MHELSLANEICDIIERIVTRDRGAAPCDVTRVVVEVGERANVEPDSLQFCLEALLGTPPFGRARAELHMVPGDDLRVAWFELDEHASGVVA